MISWFIFNGRAIYTKWKKKVKKVLFLKILFRKYKSEIMFGSDLIIIDKFEMEVHLVRNKIEEIFRCE